MKNDRTPWIFQPFVAVWNLLALVLNLTGRLIAFIIGVLSVVLGIVLLLTILAAPAGLVLIVFGFLFIIRSLF